MKINKVHDGRRKVPIGKALLEFVLRSRRSRGRGVRRGERPERAATESQADACAGSERHYLYAIVEPDLRPDQGPRFGAHLRADSGPDHTVV